MTERQSTFRRLRRDHPVFFWGTLGLLLLLIGATAAVAVRIPKYRQDAALFDRQMDQEERATRDRILESRTRRTELAVALLRRELRLKAMREKGLHLAINTEDSTLALRHGAATLRQVPVAIGPDSTIRAPDGRTWRFIRAVGERHVQRKLDNPDEPIPEWVYVSRGEPVPSEEERRVKGAIGRYILRLDDGTEIYARPEEGPLSEGVRPGAFEVRATDLRAIYDAIKPETPVFIF